MAKLTAEQQKQLDDLMALSEAPDEEDENYEVTIEIEGKAIRIPYKKAKPWLKKQGIDLDDILEEAAEGEGEEEEEEEEEDFDPEAEVEAPRRPRPKGTGKPPVKKAPAKKLAAAPPTDPEMRGRSYWRRPA